MSVLFTQGSRKLHDLVSSVAKQHHRDLLDANVTIQVLFADGGKDADERGKSALAKDGYRCAALVKATTHKDRVSGLADVVLAIDFNIWNMLDATESEALIDHELRHVCVVREKGGGVKMDPGGRPVLALRKHDFQIGGFNENVKLYGRASIEAQLLRRAMDTAEFTDQLMLELDERYNAEDDEV